MKRNIFNQVLSGTILLFVTSISSFAADGNYVNITASGKTGLGLAAYDINHALTVWAQSYGPGMGPVYVKTDNSAQNAGNAFTFYGVGAGVRAENVSGNGFSTAIGAFSGLGNNNSAAFLSARQDGAYAAKLTFRDGAGTYWSGFFSDKVLITTPVWNAGKTAILGLGDAIPQHYISATYGQGLMLKTVGTNSYIKLQENTGFVGIGKEPTANKGRLQVAGDTRVDGKIYCKSLGVLTNVWADYVLKPDYKLKPLNEVEKFIVENQHLPGIPSQQEVVKKGVDVGQMQLKLLEKTEELTLHMIALQKENVQLTERLEKIENK